MKLAVIFILCLSVASLAQDVDINTVYIDSLKELRAKNYRKASEKFKIIDEKYGFKLPEITLYNGACIYALNKEIKRSLEILNYLADEKFYSNFDHISKDPDLKNLHPLSEWKTLLEKVTKNKKTEPARKRQKIKDALLEAKKLLQKDDGKLWGKNLWHENVLFQDFEGTIFSLKKLEGSKTDDSVLFYKKLPKDTLSKTNTVQELDGEKYATILATDFYMNDESSTVIHELFHRLHFEILDAKKIKLKSDPVSYLDNFDARELLRLEYEALRKSLKAIDGKEAQSKIETSVKDAFLFRKIRQDKYKEFLQPEIEIETVEGLASYTGFKLSTFPNKYKRAISGINGWENSATYTRPFPYATGPAYGLIFDYLTPSWKSRGLDKVYNFLEIYESMYLKKPHTFKSEDILAAKARNNYEKIRTEEIGRKTLFEKRTKYYLDLLVNQPTLRVSLISHEYSMSFNMNGTLSLKNIGTVYSGIKGKSLDNSNFGNFEIDPSKAKLGETGILRTIKDKKSTYIFPLPIKIEGKTIIGKFYKIDLNDGWEVVKKNEKGDLEIVKKDAKASNK